jgi:hypothetical protein
MNVVPVVDIDFLTGIIVPNCRSVDIFLATVDHSFQDAAFVLVCFSVFGETSCKIASTWPETETGLYSGAAAMK